MNITAIIAEYNPFHNGHAYQLGLARKETDADYVIVVMSGNFVQRGAPALLDKYTRAKMALLEGADLVIELPVLWSCASAEYFAGAGIALCNQLGCVTALCYGCETLSSDVFASICHLLTDESPLYRSLLTEGLKNGASYAAARQEALLTLLPEKDRDTARKILNHPNNILALEYQKALANTASAIRVHPVARRGQGYHSGQLDASFASASAIRRFLSGCGQLHNEDRRVWSGCEQLHNEDRRIWSGCGQSGCDSRLIQDAMPGAAYQLLKDYQQRYPLLYENDCSQLLHYCLLSYAADGYCGFADCTPELSNKIRNHLDSYSDFSGFCRQLKTKDLAYTRISRVFTHILLQIHPEDYVFWRNRFYVPYARVLGFRKASYGLLGQLKKHSSIPLFTRAADAKKILASQDAHAFYKKNAFADAVYGALILEKSGRKAKPASGQQMVIV